MKRVTIMKMMARRNKRMFKRKRKDQEEHLSLSKKPLNGTVLIQHQRMSKT
jgi:hypothetical protein